jgi:hypothetical protein
MTEHITTDELRDAYTRAGLWRSGMCFSTALQSSLIRWSLEKSALARRRRYALPTQPRLI